LVGFWILVLVFFRIWLVFLGIGWFFWIVAHQQNKDMQATKPAQEQIHLIYIGNVRWILTEFYRRQLRKNSSV
jgi:nitrogen fixation-related uncharacterized protein